MRLASHGDGGSDAIDTEVGNSGIIQAGVKGIGAAARKVAVIAAGILAIACRDAAQRADFRDQLVQLGKAGGKQRSHALQQNDTAVVRLQYHAVAVDVGGCHRLFAEDVLAGLDEGDSLLCVAEIGAGDIDGVHLAAGGKLCKIGKGEGGAPLGGKHGGALCGAGIDGGKLEIGVLLRLGKELLDDGTGADGGKTDHGKILLGWFDGGSNYGIGAGDGKGAQPRRREASSKRTKFACPPQAGGLRLTCPLREVGFKRKIISSTAASNPRGHLRGRRRPCRQQKRWFAVLRQHHRG